MGNKVNRLNTFDHIVDVVLSDDYSFGQVKEAIKEKNMPFIFITLIMGDVNLDTDYGIVKLTYAEQIAQHHRKYPIDEDTLRLIQSTPTVLNKNCIHYFQPQYQDICRYIMDATEYDVVFHEALITQQIDIIAMLVTCFGFHIRNYSGVEQQFSVKELFELYQEDPHWHAIHYFMMQHYHYNRIKLFLITTLACKKALFETYKSLRLFGCPYNILVALIHDISALHYHNAIDDITSVIMFNNQLKASISNANVLTTTLDSIYCMDKYKTFWLWLKHHDIIQDIIDYLFILLCYNIDSHKVKIPLLLI
jgi:hypothetical protein